MSELLFLSHRIPYPPDKGDKIRSYHMLKALAAKHVVHVGTFVDDPADWVHAEALRRMCKGESCVRPLSPKLARLRSAVGFLSGQPLTLTYYRDAKLTDWVRHLTTQRPLAGVFAFSACMAQYAADATLISGAPRVLDLCDVDSDKWRQYATRQEQPMKFVYEREARTLAAAEARFVRDFDATLVVAEPEARLLRQEVGECGDRVCVISNGVDTDYFDPARPYERPFPGDARAIVFTGAMDYYANVDGVQWFAREVFPAIRARVPNAIFVIVGSNPNAAVRALERQQGVVVTGRVPDVRPYLAHAGVVVAPLRLARGVQNKVLEALAMDRPVVATPNALQGIQFAERAGVDIASIPSDMASAVLCRIRSCREGARGRAFIDAHYGWPAHLSGVMDLFGRQAFSARSIGAG